MIYFTRFVIEAIVLFITSMGIDWIVEITPSMFPSWFSTLLLAYAMRLKFEFKNILNRV
jgi:hypothetical protein